MADDDELADLLAEQGDDDDQPTPAPPLTDFSADHNVFVLIADRLGELLRLTAAVNSGKRIPPYRQLPRPVTAKQRARQRRRERKAALITERLAQAAAAGRPTMADLVADVTHVAAPPPRPRTDGR